jgi:hypothetical protein
MVQVTVLPMAAVVGLTLLRSVTAQVVTGRIGNPRRRAASMHFNGRRICAIPAVSGSRFPIKFDLIALVEASVTRTLLATCFNDQRLSQGGDRLFQIEINTVVLYDQLHGIHGRLLGFEPFMKWFLI